jgi:hypothetical protein
MAVGFAASALLGSALAAPSYYYDDPGYYYAPDPSGRVRCTSSWLLWANSGHRAFTRLFGRHAQAPSPECSGPLPWRS